MSRQPEHLPESASQALRGAYLDLLLLASRLMEGGGRAADPHLLRESALRSMEQQRGQLLAAAVPEYLVNEAQLAVACMLDEAAMRDRTFGAGWASLQAQQHVHLTGGEEFFKHLEVHRQNQRAPMEIFEIYARCVFLGFQGMYAPDRLKDLQIYKDALRNELRERQGPPPPLSPHLQDFAGHGVQRPILSWQWAPALAILFLCCVVLGLYAGLLGTSRDATRQIEAMSGKAAAGRGEVQR